MDSDEGLGCIYNIHEITMSDVLSKRDSKFIRLSKDFVPDVTCTQDIVFFTHNHQRACTRKLKRVSNR